jgi:FMN phosphatase YigB (HAD superfamily)
MTPIVLWDVMGTLVHDPFFQEMPRFFGMSFDSLLQAKHPDAWVEFELGKRSQEEFLSAFFSDGRGFDWLDFVNAVQRSYRWIPGMKDLLCDLHETGCSMHAFSNYPIWYRLIEDRLELSRFIEWTFVSCLTGLRKPDPRAYRHVLEELAVPAARCLFIDDRAKNCQVAREAGIPSLVFEGAGSLRSSMQGMGLL